MRVGLPKRPPAPGLADAGLGGGTWVGVNGFMGNDILEHEAGHCLGLGHGNSVPVYQVPRKPARRPGLR